MRSHLLFLVMLVMLASCGTGSSSPGPGPDGSPAPGSDGSPATSQPLQPHAVCGSLPAAELGKSCSAAGQGDLCTSASSVCGSLSCVLDARDDALHAYCAPGCASEGECPLGYACVPQHPQCQGALAGKVCARASGSGCAEVTLPGGAPLSQFYSSLFEDGAGTRYLVVGGYQKRGALHRWSAGGWSTLHSWSDGTSTQLGGVVTAAGTTLVSLPQRILVLEADKVSEETPPAPQLILGVDAAGEFVAVEPASSVGYATVYRRAKLGGWKELGPTSRKLVRAPASLGRGLVGLCGSPDAPTLCTSADGQRFDPLEAPPGAAPSPAGAPAAGRSTTDFYVVLSRELHHHRDGVWVKEGIPADEAPGAYDGRTLRLLADGAVVYGRDDGKARSLYLLAGECWRPVSAPPAASPWGGALAWVSGTSELCQLPTR